MKITDIKIRHYSLPLAPPFRAAWDPEPRRKFHSTIVSVLTDEGITGHGSGDLMTGFGGHEELFMGRDPFDIERHSKVLDNIDFHYGRCWPLDLALWDLMGKAAGRPVHALLGSASQKIRPYASTGELVTPEVRAKRALALLDEGFKAMKIRFHNKELKEDLKVVEAVRRAVGDKMEIMVDANQGWQMPWDTSAPWDLKQAMTAAKELDNLDVYWLEEPLPCHDFEGMRRLRGSCNIRIAGGEMNRRWHDFRELADRGCLDVYQPDAALCGGITLVKKIAHYVESKGAWFSPHTWTNGMGVTANLHLALAAGSCPYLEYPYDPPAWSIERRDYMIMEETRLSMDSDGYLALPDLPGMGHEPDFTFLERYRVSP